MRLGEWRLGSGLIDGGRMDMGSCGDVGDSPGEAEVAGSGEIKNSKWQRGEKRKKKRSYKRNDQGDVESFLIIQSDAM